MKQRICSYTFASPLSTGCFSREWGGWGEGVQADHSDDPCIYCGHRLHSREMSHKIIRVSETNSRFELFLRVCDKCGWWTLDRTEMLIPERPRDELLYARLAGEARHYDVSALNVPVADLRRWLARHPQDLGQVDPRRFELVMQSCLRDQFPGADVIHTGRSGDGGIDLKMIVTEEDTYLVQVKRRADLSSSEGVEVVRVLNGVLFREGRAKGIVITTAASFTEAAKCEAQVNTPTASAYEMQLLALDDVVSLLRLPCLEPYEPWVSHIRQLGEV